MVQTLPSVSGQGESSGNDPAENSWSHRPLLQPAFEQSSPVSGQSVPLGAADSACTHSSPSQAAIVHTSLSVSVHSVPSACPVQSVTCARAETATSNIERTSQTRHCVLIIPPSRSKTPVPAFLWVVPSSPPKAGPRQVRHFSAKVSRRIGVGSGARSTALSEARLKPATTARGKSSGPSTRRGHRRCPIQTWAQSENAKGGT